MTNIPREDVHCNGTWTVSPFGDEVLTVLRMNRAKRVKCVRHRDLPIGLLRFFNLHLTDFYRHDEEKSI